MPTHFIAAGPSEFLLAGEPYFVTGANCYFLAYCSERSRQEIFKTAAAMGANTLRCWAFLNVENRSPGQVAFQHPENGRIAQDTGPDGLERLDALIEAAEANGIRLILPLVNYWPDLGGMQLYLKWLGIDGPVDEFYHAPAARAAYQDWARAVITRRNTRTRRFYCEEPAIMAWELANEPRWESDGGRELLLDWVGVMSSYIKSLDRNHLLAIGDEGPLRQVDFVNIDFGTCHFYPGPHQSPESMSAWLQDQVEVARRAGKPMLLEEYGIQADPVQRNYWYGEWLATVRQHGAAGALLWGLGGTEPDTSGYRDPYTILSAADVPAINVPRPSSDDLQPWSDRSSS